jgi:hypothetical protein
MDIITSTMSTTTFYKHPLDIVAPNSAVLWEQLKPAFRLISMSSESMLEIIPEACVENMGEKWYLTRSGVFLLAVCVARVGCLDLELLTLLEHLHFQQSDYIGLPKLKTEERKSVQLPKSYVQIFPQDSPFLFEGVEMQPVGPSEVIKPQRDKIPEHFFFDTYHIKIKPALPNYREPGIWGDFLRIQLLLSMKGVSLHDDLVPYLQEHKVRENQFHFRYEQDSINCLSPLGVLVDGIKFGRTEVIEKLLWKLVKYIGADAGDISCTIQTFFPDNSQVWSMAIQHFPSRKNSNVATSDITQLEATEEMKVVEITCNSNISYGVNQNGKKFLLRNGIRYGTIPREFISSETRKLRRYANACPSLKVKFGELQPLTEKHKQEIQTFFDCPKNAVFYQFTVLCNIYKKRQWKTK